MTAHHFEPEHYFTNIAPQAPVLYIDPGDRVIARTEDAGGRDASGEIIIPGSNPMTGPFYINGAAPGNMLVLHLERITPNRASGWAGASRRPARSRHATPERGIGVTRQSVVTRQKPVPVSFDATGCAGIPPISA